MEISKLRPLFFYNIDPRLNLKNGLKALDVLSMFKPETANLAGLSAEPGANVIKLFLSKIYEFSYKAIVLVPVKLFKPGLTNIPTKYESL
jgi:hypothetical protein